MCTCWQHRQLQLPQGRATPGGEPEPEPEPESSEGKGKKGKKAAAKKGKKGAAKKDKDKDKGKCKGKGKAAAAAKPGLAVEPVVQAQTVNLIVQSDDQVKRSGKELWMLAGPKLRAQAQKSVVKKKGGKGGKAKAEPNPQVDIANDLTIAKLKAPVRLDWSRAPRPASTPSPPSSPSTPHVCAVLTRTLHAIIVCYAGACLSYHNQVRDKRVIQRELSLSKEGRGRMEVEEG